MQILLELCSCSDIGENPLSSADSTKQPPIMAVLRRIRRRLRLVNPCTTLLVVVLLVVVVYLISAIRGSIMQSSVAALAAERHRESVGPGVGDRRLLSGLRSADQRGRRKDGTGSFVVDDDEIQLCTMTPRWAASAVEQQDDLRLSVESPVRRRHVGISSCAESFHDPMPPELFYVDAEGRIRYNSTAGSAGGSYEVVVKSCEAWKIEFDLEAGYVQKHVSLLAKVDADFIRVSCRLRRSVDGGGGVGTERTTSRTAPGGPRRRRSSDRQHHHETSSLVVAERRAQQMHRDQLRRFSPHFVGTVGLPDPLSGIVTEQRTSSSETSSAPEKHPVRDDPRSRHDEPALVKSTTHREDQGKRGEERESKRGDKTDDAQIATRSERHQNRTDETGNVKLTATDGYDQWIARIHPDSEVAARETATTSKRLNVLILAMESVSSMSFATDLPKSHRFLVNQPNTVLFTGYNVIGDAAPANIIPVLTGAYRRMLLQREKESLLSHNFSHKQLHYKLDSQAVCVPERIYVHQAGRLNFTTAVTMSFNSLKPTVAIWVQL